MVTTRKKTKNLLFSSIGARQSILNWVLGQTEQFDLALFVYEEPRGLDLRIVEASAEFYMVGAGSKFKGFKQLIDKFSIDISDYEGIWLLDDDIELVGSFDITNFFDIIRHYDLDVLSPCHSADGYISHKIMAYVSGAHTLRYTNFVEMTCPLFSASFLSKFLEVYDETVLDWGIDWHYSYLSHSNDVGKLAITDQFEIKNPHAYEKNGGFRENDKLGSDALRQNLWEKAKENSSFQYYNHLNLGVI